MHSAMMAIHPRRSRALSQAGRPPLAMLCLRLAIQARVLVLTQSQRQLLLPSPLGRNTVRFRLLVSAAVRMRPKATLETAQMSKRRRSGKVCMLFQVTHMRMIRPLIMTPHS